jgi:hypothetical protein
LRQSWGRRRAAAAAAQVEFGGRRWLTADRHHHLTDRHKKICKTARQRTLQLYPERLLLL